jgi:phage baseplate assembly protein gpV
MERPSGSIVTLGLVTSLDDPESAGRVQVHLPTYGDVETGWMGVLCAGAGESKGMVLLPDVGDQVMVLFPREDPANGFILGGLYGVKGIYDSGVDKNSVLRYSLKTRGGLKFLLDDEHHAIHLEDSTGSSIDFSPEKVFLHAAVDLNLEAPGHNVVIRGKAIDFQRG